MKLIKLTVILIFGLFTLTSFAQNDDVKNEPGYVDFGNLGSFEEGNNVTEINLGANILKMVGKLTENDDPDLSKMIDALKLIKVSVFEVNKSNTKDLTVKMNTIDGKLMSSGWSRIVRSRDNGEIANVYIKSSDKGFDGLVVTNLDKDGEAAFVNIVGPIDMELIGKLGKKFDIHPLEGIKKHENKKD